MDRRKSLSAFVAWFFPSGLFTRHLRMEYEYAYKRISSAILMYLYEKKKKKITKK